MLLGAHSIARMHAVGRSGNGAELVPETAKWDL